MLLLLFAGAKASSAPTVTGCAFQDGAFQANAFQPCPTSPVTKKKVGWHPSWGFTHTPEELERRLANQRGVSSAWFDDFIEAQRAVSIRVATTKSAKHKAALDTAAATVYAAVENAIAHDWAPPTEMIVALLAAANASRITASIKRAEAIMRMAEDDDEEALILLLN